ncbi:MAG: hypothetical protein ACYC27_17905 [Armatimonadota bacterium]
MTGFSIKKLIIGIILIALAGSIFTGAAVTAGEKPLKADSQCLCLSHEYCSSSCMEIPVSGGCGCRISPMPDNETPVVVPVTSRQTGIDNIAAILPVMIELTSSPRLVWTVTHEQDIHDIFHYSSSDGRAPPANTSIIYC